jgi:hypothetical protein
MTEFQTQVNLAVKPDPASLRAARQEIEDELGDVTVDVQATGGGQQSQLAGRDASKQTALLDQLVEDTDRNLDLNQTRNDLLRELIQAQETDTFTRAVGGGAGGAVGLGAGAGAVGLAGVGALGLLLQTIPDIPDNIDVPEIPNKIPIPAVDDIPEEIGIEDLPLPLPVEDIPSIEIAPPPFPIPIPVAEPGEGPKPDGQPQPETDPAPSPSPSPAPDGVDVPSFGPNLTPFFDETGSSDREPAPEFGPNTTPFFDETGLSTRPDVDGSVYGPAFPEGRGTMLPDQTGSGDVGVSGEQVATGAFGASIAARGARAFSGVSAGSPSTTTGVGVPAIGPLIADRASNNEGVREWLQESIREVAGTNTAGSTGTADTRNRAGGGGGGSPTQKNDITINNEMARSDREIERIVRRYVNRMTSDLAGR